MRKEGDRNQILEQIAAIQKRLAKGTYIVKEGHRIGGISDGSQTLELPFIGGMASNRESEINKLLKVLQSGHSNKKYYPNR